ncbi:DUF4349 domain-containing protein [Paenibacillus oceani]|uniref:DUF4349 domain-containing protein n=1 Tax=Paenibacillus oceani TaxID=2772510 RepID=A0A927C5M7_9BACL|nr:DUF4349 domain-containing protein [Paenibacillus oceani]MBD2861809.1 DUF4349 domain-containing protein [Paenibacillus oceani]
MSGFRRGRKTGTVLLAGCLLAVGLLAGCGSAKEATDQAMNSESAPAPTMAAKQESAQIFNANDSGTAAGAAEQTDSIQATSGMTNVQSGAGAPASVPGAAPTGQQPASIDRQIIYKANVTMEVAEYGSAHTEINNLVHLSGGYLLQFSENRTDYEQSGILVVKVPSKGFSGFLANLEKMKPKSIQRSVQGQDVTEEYVDLTSRLKAREAELARLFSFMDKATKSEDLVTFSKQIETVQTEVERLKGRMRYLEQNVAYSTVEIRLYQKIEKAKVEAEKAQESGFASKLAKALKGSAKVVLGFLQGVVIVLAGALPVLAVLAVVGIPAATIYRRRRARMKELEERSRSIRRQNLSQIESDSEADRDADHDSKPPASDA